MTGALHGMVLAGLMLAPLCSAFLFGAWVAGRDPWCLAGTLVLLLHVSLAVFVDKQARKRGWW